MSKEEKHAKANKRKHSSKKARKGDHTKDRLTGAKNGGVCLLTGFGSFGKHKSNPSQLTAQAFPDNFQSDKGTDLQIESVVLDTIGSTAWKNLKKAVKKKEPSIIIMLGLASGRKAISLERFAMNLRDYSIPDVEGQKVKDKPVDKDGPDLIRNPLDLEKIRKRVLKSGYPCEISNHAGTFICNELYYSALKHSIDDKAIAACLFVHVPELMDFSKSASISRKKSVAGRAKNARQQKRQLSLLRDGIAAVLSAVADQVI